MALKVYQDTFGSNTAVGLLILAFTIPSIFFGYLAGVLVDHHDLKKVLVLTNLFRGLLILSLIVSGSNILLVYAIVLLLSLITLFFLPAEGSALPALVPEKKDLLAANSLFTLTYQASLIIGFIAAGPMLSLFGDALTYLILSGFFVLALFSVWILPDSLRSIEQKEGISSLRSFLEGIIFFIKTRTVRDAIVFLTATQAIILVLATVGPGFVDKVLDLDVRLTSIVLVAPAAFGMIVGSVFLTKFAHQYTERTLVNLGLFLAAGAFFALAILERSSITIFILLTAVFFIVLLGLAAAFITIPATTELQADTPERMRGRAYGILGTFVSGISALPVLLAGAIGDTFGVRSVVLTMGVVILCVALYRVRGRRYT